MKFLPACSLALVLNFPCYAADEDTYANFAELSQNEKENVDFSITALDRSARVLVMAIHGGMIESPTGSMAKTIAGDDLNLYVFESLPGKKASRLHITSTHFDEPRALNLAASSDYCLSLHGFKDDEASKICIGGGHTAWRQMVETGLNRAFPDVEMLNPCEEFVAVTPKNIVNKCRKKGVQLELSSRFRKDLQSNPEQMTLFLKTLRDLALRAERGLE